MVLRFPNAVAWRVTDRDQLAAGAGVQPHAAHPNVGGSEDRADRPQALAPEPTALGDPARAGTRAAAVAHRLLPSAAPRQPALGDCGASHDHLGPCMAVARAPPGFGGDFGGHERWRAPTTHPPCTFTMIRTEAVTDIPLLRFVYYSSHLRSLYHFRARHLNSYGRCLRSQPSSR
jgi:hypothetical protein